VASVRRLREDRALLRVLACAVAVGALASLVVLGVADAVGASQGQEAFGVLGVASFVVGVRTPTLVGLILIWRRPQDAGGLDPAGSVGVVMAAVAVAAVALYEDRDSALGAWALLLAHEWLVLFASVSAASTRSLGAVSCVSSTMVDTATPFSEGVSGP
jgi:hypothetical protein